MAALILLIAFGLMVGTAVLQDSLVQRFGCNSSGLGFPASFICNYSGGALAGNGRGQRAEHLPRPQAL